MSLSRTRLACMATVALSALCAGMTATAARADDGWAIQPSAASGGAAYCTMVRAGASGPVLTYALNAENKTSLAIDYREPIFKPGQAVSFDIDVGGMKRTIKTQAVSASALVIPLDGDAGLDTALKSSPRLAVKAEGRSDAIGLDGFAQARADLSACLKQASAPPAAPKEEEAPHSAEKSPAVNRPNDALALEGENAKLRRALEEERRELEQARLDSAGSAKLMELEEKVRTLESRNRALEAQAKPDADTVLPQQVADLQAQRDALEKQNRSMANELNTVKESLKRVEEQKKAPPAPAAPDETARLKQQMESLKAQNARLSADLVSAESRVTKAEKSAVSMPAVPPPAVDAVELTSLKADNARLARELAEAKADMMASLGQETGSDETDRLRNQVAQLELDKHSLEQALSAAQVSANAAGDLASTRAPIRRQLRELLAENGALKTQIQHLADEMEALQMRAEAKELNVAGNNWDLELATRRYQEAEREIQRLGRSLDQQQQQCVAEKKEIEYMLFDPKVASGAQGALVNSLQDQISDLQAELTVLRNSARDGQSALAARQAPRAPQDGGAVLGDLKKAHQREVDMLERKIAALETRSLAEPEVPDARAIEEENAMARERDAYQAQVAALTQKLSDVETRLAEQPAPAAAPPRPDAEIAALNARLAEMDSRLNAQQQENEAVRRQNRALAEKAARVPVAPSVSPAPVLADTSKTSAGGGSAFAAASSGDAPAAPSRPALVPPSSAAKNIESDLQTPMGAVVSMPAVPVRDIAPVPAAATTASGILETAQITAILGASGVTPSRPVQGQSTGGKTIYQWDVGPVQGFFHQEKAASLGFEGMIESYLNAMDGKCPGDFAAMPSETSFADAQTAQAFETACAPKAGSADSLHSAALLFTFKDGLFTVLTYGAPGDAMDRAIGLRDQFAAQIAPMRTAAR